MDLSRAARQAHSAWTLIGGHALISHGVPRHTEDVDTLFLKHELLGVAEALVANFGYVPLIYNIEHEGYVATDEVTVHYMDDPVLFSVGEERELVPLESPLGLIVELLAAQHPIEREMIEASALCRHYGVLVPIAPLGGVLLVKSIADRVKDVAAIEQTAESLPREDLEQALTWAAQRDPENTKDLRAIITNVRTRRIPKTTRSYRFPKR